MFVMSMLDRLTDVKKSTYAKIIAVLVSVAMVLSLTNMSAFAEGDGLSGIFGGNSDVVKVAVDLDNAKIEYGDQTVTNADKTFVASAGKDLKFKASAVTEDFTLDEVALVTTAENGNEVVTDLESIDGTYTIKADDVADGITIKASATEMAPAENQSIQETAAQAEQAPAKAARAGQWNNGNNYVTENINQNSADKYPQGDYVFIFLKVNQGDNITGIADKYKYTDGSKVWYTYGFVQVDGLRTAEGYTITDDEYEDRPYADNDADTVNANINEQVKTGKVTPLDGNEKAKFNGKPLDFSASGFWEFNRLTAANKAKGVTGTDENGKEKQTRTWHKNITLNDTRTVTVKYVDDKGNSLKEPNVTTVVKGGNYDVSNLIPDSISVNNKTYNRASNIEGNVSGTANDNVVITVQYSPNIRQYTVKFIDATTQEEIKGTVTKEAPVSSKVPVKDEFVEIPGYNFSKVVINGQNKPYSTIPDDLTMVVQGSHKSEITFYYTKRTDLSYTVNYLEQGTNAVLADPQTVTGTPENPVAVGQEVQAYPIDIPGYLPVNEDAAGFTTISATEDNVINIYYTKRTDLSYTVNYLEQGTNAVLADPQTVTGTPENPVAVGQEVQAYPIDIPGYLPVNEDAAGFTTISATEDNVINIYYTKRTDLSYTVNYYFDKVLGDAPEGATTGGKATYLEEVAIMPASSVTVGENTYTLTSTEHKIASISANENENVINVYYELDNVVDPGEDPYPTQPGDGIPDKYQAMVLFTTADEAQGTVGGDTTKVFTLRDAADNLVESADVNVTADGVTTTAAEGYAFFNWTGAEFGTQTLKGNDVVTFVANWAEDNVGTDPAYPDQGDGIPDIYQALVQYVAVNGSVNIDHTYVTLLDENGQPAENGTGYLTAEQIAVATAAEGYDQDSLAWDVVPTTENAITGEVTYTVTFTANQPVVPAGPDTPGTTTPTPAPAGPVPGAAPAALAPVAAALAAPVAALIGDEPTPLAEEAIGDEEDPLAAFDHVNCWVHYYMILGILLTLVYGGCVIARRSNYSRKIQKMDDYATGKAMDTVEETENVANAAAQKMEA